MPKRITSRLIHLILTEREAQAVLGALHRYHLNESGEPLHDSDITERIAEQLRVRLVETTR